MQSMSPGAILFNADPAAYLPHRPPFLFIDRVLSLDAGVAATGELNVPAGGYFPPVLLVEAMAQLGGIAAGQSDGEAGFLAALGRVQLPAAVAPRAKLHLSSRVVKAFGRLVQVEGEVREQEAVIATATLTLGIGSAW
jgi:3-hydroxyacyl-[acyl-carrier-protein] dehydratase